MKLIKQIFGKWLGLFLGLAVLVSLGACSSTKQAVLSSSDDVNVYKLVQLPDLEVASDDATTDGANEASDRIKSYYKDAIAKAMSATNRSVVSAASAAAPEKLLVVDGRLDVHYGSRAMRYFIGFGAGKGSATLTLIAKDAATGQEKYKDVRTVELKMGAFGGSFEDMIKAQMSEQIQQFASKSQK